MTSIPQLRKDLNDTQLKLFAAEAEIRRLNDELIKKPKIKTVIKQSPPEIQYRDKIVEKLVQAIKVVNVEVDSQKTLDKLAACRDEIRQLKADLEVAKSSVIVQEKIVEVPVIEYRDNPRHKDMIRKLRGK